MAVNYTPLAYDWPSITKGDTYSPQRIQETLSDTGCARVRVEVRNSKGEIVITRDSDVSGITIADSTAGAWDFTIDAFTAAETGALPVGTYSCNIEVTDSAGSERTEFKGYWKIKAQ